MQQLYQAADRIEAQLLCDLLDRHGVEARVFGDYLSGAAGELPADIYPSIWVIEDRDLPRAQTLLKGWLDDKRARAEARSWVCHGCGELVDGSFDLCWRCGKEH
ncbi:putative signal transducing protein [Halochromatium sp.]